MTVERGALRKAVEPALRYLPAKMDSARARVILLAICLQESRLTHRYQIVQGKPGVKGPARGIAQFERGTPSSRGGVTGVLMHPASGALLREFCARRDIPATASAIWEMLEYDDVLSIGVARLLLWTDPQPLPEIGDVEGGWRLYSRTWRPGRPHPETWPGLYARAVAAVEP